MLHRLNDATLAEELAARILFSDEVNARHSLACFDDELHAAMALPLLPVQEDGEIVLERLTGIGIIELKGLAIVLLEFCLSVKKLVSNDHSINGIANLEER